MERQRATEEALTAEETEAAVVVETGRGDEAIEELRGKLASDAQALRQ
jgi:hypothetical protein